jgi:hypothetical protein
MFDWLVQFSNSQLFSFWIVVVYLVWDEIVMKEQQEMIDLNWLRMQRNEILFTLLKIWTGEFEDSFLWRNEFSCVLSQKNFFSIEFWLISYRNKTRRIHVDHFRFKSWSQRALFFPFETKKIVVASRIS